MGRGVDGCHTWSEGWGEERKGVKDDGDGSLQGVKSFLKSWYKLETKKKKLGPLALAHP
jgi:hypothetical protein